MQVYSIPTGVEGPPSGPFQSRDTPITSQPLFSGNQLREAEPNQLIDSLSHRHAIEYLKSTDNLFIQQNIALLEVVLGIEASNSYQVLNPMGQKVFTAYEESDCCTRHFLGPIRNFELHLYDNLNNQVMRMHRPLACNCNCQCCACWRQKLEVFCPIDVLVGYVEQEFSWLHPMFGIFDKDGMKVLRIEGPIFQCSCCKDVEYQILGLTGEVIGKISKQWMGFLQEGFTDADSFHLEFPANLDVNMKIVLLGAAFLTDYMFYETKKTHTSSSLANLLR